MRALIFDEAVSGLDDVAMEQIAQTANELKGKVTILFITHKVPKSLKVDAHLQLSTSGERAQRTLREGVAAATKQAGPSSTLAPTIN